MLRIVRVRKEKKHAKVICHTSRPED